MLDFIFSRVSHTQDFQPLELYKSYHCEELALHSILLYLGRFLDGFGTRIFARNLIQSYFRSSLSHINRPYRPNMPQSKKGNQDWSDMATHGTSLGSYSKTYAVSFASSTESCDHPRCSSVACDCFFRYTCTCTTSQQG